MLSSGGFTNVAIIARDTIMAVGSSVASESTFSDSGDMVSAERSRLSDEHIRMLITLRSWNRFLVIFG